MQLTVRSYLMAGMAAAGAGALAIAPLPSLVPDVSIPSVEAPVDLAATPSPLELLLQGVGSAATLANGAFTSAGSAGTSSATTRRRSERLCQVRTLRSANPEQSSRLSQHRCHSCQRVNRTS